MRVYLAGPWIHRADAKDVAEQIREGGHTIVSRWHDEWAESDSHDPDVLKREAFADFTDLRHAEVLVVLNTVKSEGKAVEQGIALCMDIPIIAVGTKRLNVFQYLPDVTLVPDIYTAIQKLNLLSLESDPMT